MKRREFIKLTSIIPFISLPNIALAKKYVPLEYEQKFGAPETIEELVKAIESCIKVYQKDSVDKYAFDGSEHTTYCLGCPTDNEKTRKRLILSMWRTFDLQMDRSNKDSVLQWRWRPEFTAYEMEDSFKEFIFDGDQENIEPAVKLTARFTITNSVPYSYLKMVKKEGEKFEYLDM